MPDIFGQPTPSEMLAIVKSNRLLSEEVRGKTGVPHDEIAGKVIMFQHTVTTAEDTANSVQIKLADMNVVDAMIVQITSNTGVIKSITPTVTYDPDSGIFEIAGTGFVATDICNILIKGRKV